MSWDEDDSFDSNKQTHGEKSNAPAAAGGEQKTEFKKSILSEGKLALQGYKTDQMEYPPKLQVEVRRNQVHITIWTSVKGDERRPITCRFSAPMYFALLQLMHDVETMDADTVISIDNKVQDKETKKPVLDTKFVIGRDKDGNFFLAGTAKGCTRVPFTFGYERYHDFYVNGTQMTKQQASLLQMRAYRNLMHALVPQVLAANYDPAPKGDWKGKSDWKGKGGGGGGNYNKSGGKNDYGSRDTGFDNDTSF